MSFLGIDPLDAIFVRRDISSTPEVDDAFDLGSPVLRWANIFATNLSYETLTTDATGALVLPSGITGERPSPPSTGMLRFNTSTTSFEGYTGTQWTGLGGVIDVDGDTRITAESAPAADEDILTFYANGTVWLEIKGTGTHVMNGDWTLGVGATLEATFADIAERYKADMLLTPGSVVVLGGTEEITACTEAFDTKVLGVVSTSPAFKLNSEAGDNNTHPYIALTGRVPCNVIGTVNKGDLLVTSEVPGAAMSVKNIPGGNPIGAILGKAITEWDSDVPGQIEIVIMLG